MNHHMPMCHYSVKLSEEITHDSARTDFHCLLGRLLHVSPFVLTLICTVTSVSFLFHGSNWWIHPVIKTLLQRDPQRGPGQSKK